MSAHDDGGPAFPCDVFDPHVDGPEQHEGMSLRDYFAGKALTGMLGTAGAPCLGGLDGYEDVTAKAVYRMADAMIRARATAPQEGS